MFQFKYFSIQQENSSLKVGTDAMLLGASIDQNYYKNILDIGTGTGVLALMAKQQNPDAIVVAIDIDEQSLIDCKQNFEASIWEKDLHCFNQNFETYVSSTKFDCIICNPPYYENGLLSDSDSNNRAKHTSEFSLEQLFLTAKSLLTSDGHFYIILPVQNADKWETFSKKIGFSIGLKRVVFAKPNQVKRVIFKFTSNVEKCINDDLIIRNVDNTYSESYKNLTKEFHNKEL